MAALLPNEGFLGRRDGEWEAHGDAVDIALLILGYRAGIEHSDLLQNCPEMAHLSFESEHLMAASLNRVHGEPWIFVRGAL